jgi:hypothetical protein
MTMPVPDRTLDRTMASPHAVPTVCPYAPD